MALGGAEMIHPGPRSNAAPRGAIGKVSVTLMIRSGSTFVARQGGEGTATRSIRRRSGEANRCTGDFQVNMPPVGST